MKEPGGERPERRLEDRETKLRALRRILDSSIAEGGAHSDEEVEAALNAVAEDLAREGR